MNFHKADVKKETAKKYHEMYPQLAAYHPGRLLTELDEDDLKLFLVYLRDERPKLDPKGEPRSGCVLGLEASTRKAYVGAVGFFYRKLRKWKLVEDDPAEDVKSPKVTIKQGFTISETELRQILCARGSERDTIQAYLLAYTLAQG